AWRRSGSGVRCSMKNSGSGVARPQGRGLPAQRLAGGRLACAVAWVTDVDATLAHPCHVGCEVVALHGDVAQSPAPRQKLEEAPARMAGEVLVPIVHAQQFEIVLLVKRDGVVRALARMHAAARGVGAEARAAVTALP